MHDLDRRERQRQATISEIKATARSQMERDGATNLSLAAIARSMGLTTPALYRYFENRDALVVALIAESYDSMGECLEQAVGSRPVDDFLGRFLALMRAYRQWAREHREDYGLMYGAQVYGSTVTFDQIGPAVTRSLRVMVELFQTSHEAGHLSIPEPYREPPPSFRQALAGLRSVLEDESLALGILALSFSTWLLAHGMVWQELHGVLPEVLFGTGELYEMEIQILARRLELAA
jgi:AcrR family transcriptional regulator